MMRKSSMAILWAANTQIAGSDMPFEEADVDSNIEVIKERGAVYWDSKAKRNEAQGPLDGYIYIAGEKLVKYRCRVQHMISRETLLRMGNEHQYVPEFRKQCLHGHFPNGREHEQSETWIKILKIEPLKRPLKLGDFRKWKDKKPVKLVRAPIYIDV